MIDLKKEIEDLINKEEKFKKEHTAEQFKAEVRERTRIDVVGTGISSLDDFLSHGFKEGELSVISGRPGMGKSSLLFSLAFNMALCEDNTVLYFSLKESREQILERYLKLNNNDKNECLKTSEYNNFLIHSSNDGILHHCKERLFSVKDLKHEFNKLIWNCTQDINVIFIDDFDLLTLNNSFNKTEREEILFNIKKLSKLFRIPIIVSIGAARSVELRYGEKKPMCLSDLYYDESIDYYADIICFLYRGECYQVSNESNSYKNDPTELIFVKNNKRELGTTILYFNRETLYFAEVESKPLT